MKKIHLFHFMCMSTFLHVWDYMHAWCPRRFREASDPLVLELQIVMSCFIYATHIIYVLCKSNKHSRILTHLVSHLFILLDDLLINITSCRILFVLLSSLEWKPIFLWRLLQYFAKTDNTDLLISWVNWEHE